jgi:DNA modification methylase
MKLSEIKPNPDNPRLIKDDKFEKLVKSLKDFPKMMELRPIIVDENNIIQGGNMRFKALKALGYKDIPDEWVKQAKDLTPEQWREFVIKDNLAYGEMNWDMILSDWNQELLKEWGLDIPPLEDKTEAKEDNYEVPEEIETDITEGDLIEIGPHRLLCGDSTKQKSWKTLFEGKQSDLIVTDPPYNVNYGDTSKILNDNMSDSNFLQFLTDAFARCFEHSKDGGAIYVFHADSEGYNFRTAFLNSGFDLKQCLIWVKNTLVLGRQDYQWKHEPCLYGWKEGSAHFFIGDRTNTTVIEDIVDYKKLSKAELLKIVQEIMSDNTPSSVIHCDKPSKNDLHPTMKPVLLLAYLIKNSSTQGQIVADPFLGSGSTMVAAHQIGRKCYGMELDPKYCQVIIDRMQKLDPQITIKKHSLSCQEDTE